MPRRQARAGEDPLARAHRQLTDAVDALVHGDAWQEMLQVAARFPRYSPNNVLLITAQRPDATRVAGLRTWNTLGRRVLAGEKGIAILAPCTYKTDRATSGDRDGARPGADATDDTSQRLLRGFRVVHVFDVEQTHGEPLPDVRPQLLDGAAPQHLWERLDQLAVADGYTVERGPCGAANGYTDPASKLIRVRDDVEPAQACKTLAHELGHVRADHPTRFAEQYHQSMACRGVAEVEAESIAYVVLAASSLDSSNYTAPYVATWAGGGTEVLRETAQRVIETARRIVHDIGTEHDNLSPPWRSASVDAGVAHPAPDRRASP